MEKDFENLGIYDLRNYARAMGVHSPTTLKRDELIARINQIVEGDIPEGPKSKKGRKPKHMATDNYVLNMILPNDLFKMKDDTYKNYIDKSAFKNVFSANRENVACDNLPFQGFFDQVCDEYGLVYLKGYKTDYSKENTLILRPLAEQFELKTGDYVVGRARYITEKNILLATDIEYVNDVKNIDVDRIDFENTVPKYPTQIISLKNSYDSFADIDSFCPLTRGARVSFFVNNDAMKFEVVKNVLNALSMQNEIRTLLLTIDDNPEEIGMIMKECPDVEICKLSINQTREQFFDKVEMYIKNCISRLEFSQSVAVVLYNANNFKTALVQNIMINQNILEPVADVIATNKVKDIFDLSRNFENGNLTMIAFDAFKELESRSNCIINLRTDENNKLTLDKDKSITKGQSAN